MDIVLDDKLNELFKELYYKTYRDITRFECPLDDDVFITLLMSDVRVRTGYRIYKKDHDVSSIRDYILQNRIDIKSFIIEHILDVPDEHRPKDLVPREKYPFLFIISKDTFSRQTLKEFIIDKNAMFMQRHSSVFKDLSLPDNALKEILVKELEDEISLLDQAWEKQLEDTKPDKKVYKYNTDNVLLHVYDDRNECCEKEGFKKAALSHHLTGKRKTLNGHIYKEF